MALAVFVAFSGLGGLADSGSLLVLARFVTGVAAGFMTPAGLSIITTSFEEGPLRDRAVVIYGATGAGGFSLGMVAGGLLTSVSWRWVFFAPVILGALLFVAGRALIRPDVVRAASPARFDIVGALTVTGAMVAGVYGLVTLGEAHDPGAWWARRCWSPRCCSWPSSGSSDAQRRRWFASRSSATGAWWAPTWPGSCSWPPSSASSS